jgi:hypothetical protein
MPKSGPSMSFSDFKIDYNHPLGSGVFGTVYQVVPRPANEKGFFSYYFPYVYDYLFRIDPSKNLSAKYCVKISKTWMRMVYENPEHPFRFRLPWHSLFEGAKEENTNTVLRKHKMSNITFFKTYSFYAQFKSLVHGKTLHHYLETEDFINPDRFILRKSFVEFMHFIKDPRFTFWELHEYNIMFDEEYRKWEIVDGIFNEVDDTKLERHRDNLNFFLTHLIQSKVSNATKSCLEALADFARNYCEYTEEHDQDILRSVTITCVL